MTAAGVAAPTSEAEALTVAQEFAMKLAADVVERDRANANPVDEVRRFREAGLVPLLVPVELGGAGLSWEAVLRVVRPIIRADASIGHLVAYHYLNSWRTVLNEDSAAAHALWRGTASELWFWGGAGNPRDEGLVLVRDGDDYLVSGRKFFATGASVADKITASATIEGTGEKVAIVIDGHADGVTHPLDWDNIGQRLSASGSVTFDRVRVPASQLLGASEQTGPGQRAFSSLSILFFQLLLSHIHVGIAEGALEAAAGYARSSTKPWPTSGVDSALKDPYILATLGELVAATRASDALVWAATRRAVAAVERGFDLTDEERGELAVEITAAKVNSTRTVLDVTARAFELTGARATSASHSFDRFWRNARTISLHDPVAYKAKELGEYALTGTHPTPSKYS